MPSTNDPDIERLLHRIRSGDGSAREELLARYRDRLRRMIAARMDDELSTRVDPSDVVQETLIVAADRLPDYLREPSVSFYPWLRKIAWNRLVDLHRAHVLANKRSVKRESFLGMSGSSVMSLAESLVANQANPLSGMIREELYARVHATLARLSPSDREILLLRYVEDLSSRECAHVLGISETASRQRHVRAVQRLRNLLADEQEGLTS